MHPYLPNLLGDISVAHKYKGKETEQYQESLANHFQEMGSLHCAIILGCGHSCGTVYGRRKSSSVPGNSLEVILSLQEKELNYKAEIKAANSYYGLMICF